MSTVKLSSGRGASDAKTPAYRSKKTHRPVTTAWALRNPGKVYDASAPVNYSQAAKNVIRDVTARVRTNKRGAKSAVKKRSRVVKRDRDTGEFAKKTSRKRSVTNDIVKAPAKKPRVIKVVGKAVITDAKVGLGSVEPFPKKK